MEFLSVNFKPFEFKEKFCKQESFFVSDAQKILCMYQFNKTEGVTCSTKLKYVLNLVSSFLFSLGNKVSF